MEPPHEEMRYEDRSLKAEERTVSRPVSTREEEIPTTLEYLDRTKRVFNIRESPLRMQEQ